MGDYTVSNALRAIDRSAMDWPMAGKYFPSELYWLAAAADLGLSRDFYLEDPQVQGTVAYLRELDSLDRELAIQALNSGIPIFDVIRQSRDQTQKAIAERANTNQKLPPTSLEITPLVLAPSRWEESKHPEVMSLTIGGIRYGSMAEKLLVSMACGARIDRDEPLVDLPAFGFGFPRFVPPRVVKASDSSPCGRTRAWC